MSKASAANAFEGHVDRIENACVVGWGWNSKSSSEPIEVDVLVDGVFATRLTANLYRPDLERAGKGNGCHAFEVALLDHIKDGLAHEVRIVFTGTAHDLIGSPLSVRPEVSVPRIVTGTDRPTGPTYRSRFGGLWTDLSNVTDIIDGKFALEWIFDSEARLLHFWVKHGFVVLPQAVSHDVIDELDIDVEKIWNGTSSSRVFVESWERGLKTIRPAAPSFKDCRTKLLDLFAHSDAARRIIFASPIIRFLTLVFERPAVAFQSLYFRWGSQQDMHQDTAFVKVSSPVEFAASWVALEDIQPRSGELEYYDGSHQLDDYLFDRKFKWLPFHSTENAAFVASLHARSLARGFERKRFLLKKGDVVIWSADLVHGGSKEVTEGITRKSLVTHYCPSNCDPIYANAGVAYPRHRFNDSAYYTFPDRD